MMHAAEDAHLKLIETELRFISRHAGNLPTDDHDSVHEISLAVNSALRALAEYRLEPPAGVRGNTGGRRASGLKPKGAHPTLPNPGAASTHQSLSEGFTQ